MGFTNFEEHKPANSQFTIGNSDGTGLVAATMSLGLNQRVDSILVANSDTIDHVVQVWIGGLGLAVLAGSVIVPHGAGHAGAKAVDVIDAAFPLLPGGIVLGENDSVQLSVEVAMVAPHFLSCNTLAGTF